jgi:hypothetical protein
MYGFDHQRYSLATADARGAKPITFPLCSQGMQ